MERDPTQPPKERGKGCVLAWILEALEPLAEVRFRLLEFAVRDGVSSEIDQDPRNAHAVTEFTKRRHGFGVVLARLLGPALLAAQ